MLKKYYQRVFAVVIGGLLLFILESIIKYYFILNKISSQGFYLFWDLLQINYFANFNIAFGLPLPQSIIIVLVIIILICLSFIWWSAFLQKKIWQVLAISLIILGALSNLFDRLVIGHVVDYLNVFIWPVFNMADVMIVFGIVLYLILNYNKTPLK